MIEDVRAVWQLVGWAIVVFGLRWRKRAKEKIVEVAGRLKVVPVAPAPAREALA